DRRLDAEARVPRALEVEGLWRGRGLAAVGDDLGEKAGEPPRVAERPFRPPRLVHVDDLEPLVQEGLGVEPEADGLGGEGLLAEDLGVGAEGDRGARAARGAELLELGHRLAALVALLPVRAVAL